MKDKKLYITIIIILILYLITILILNYTGFFKQKTSYIVFSDNNILKIVDTKYEFIEKDFEQIENKKFDVYDYNKYLGKYNVKINDNTYKVYDDNFNLVKFQNNFIATYSENDNLKLNESEIETINQTDKEILYNILKERDINTFSLPLFAEKRKINIDNKDDVYIYNVSNNNVMNNDAIIFSLVYVYNGKDYIIIDYSSANNNEKNNVPSYYIEAIVDIDNDGTDEIVLDKQVFSQNGEQLKIIYKYDKTNYTELISINK